MKHIILTAMIALVAAAPLATAQAGPAPGQDPSTYAMLYAEERAIAIATDPQGAAQEAFAGGAEAEADHAAYVACWAFYDATGRHDEQLCGDHFTPPQNAAPEPVPGDDQRDEVGDAAQETGEVAIEAWDDSRAFIDEATGVVNDALRDPDTAPGGAFGLLASLQDIADGLASGARSIVTGLVRGLVEGLEAPVSMMSAVGDALSAAGDALGTAVGTASRASVDGIVAVVQVVADVGSAAVEAAVGLVGGWFAAEPTPGGAVATLPESPSGISVPSALPLHLADPLLS